MGRRKSYADTFFGDRRRTGRYDIGLNFSWRQIPEEGVGKFGTGHTLNVGSSGFYGKLDGQFDWTLPVPLEVAIFWPVCLGGVPLKLVCRGIVLRIDEGGLVAFQIEHHEFHTHFLGISMQQSA